ncbi:MAG: dihydroneopterin aldolase [Verrucomicrobiota bacterium]
MSKDADRIFLRGLAFFGFHGNIPLEAVHGQRFYVDLEMRMDAGRASATDHLEDTIDYSAVYEAVRCLVETERFNLLETLAEKVAQAILEKFALVSSVVVEVKKPQAPLPGIFNEVSVAVERWRKE